MGAFGSAKACHLAMSSWRCCFRSIFSCCCLSANCDCVNCCDDGCCGCLSTCDDDMVFIAFVMEGVFEKNASDCEFFFTCCFLSTLLFFFAVLLFACLLVVRSSSLWRFLGRHDGDGDDDDDASPAMKAKEANGLSLPKLFSLLVDGSVLSVGLLLLLIFSTSVLFSFMFGDPLASTVILMVPLPILWGAAISLSLFRCANLLTVLGMCRLLFPLLLKPFWK
mmetsp:Transcript_10920/g.23142  ORF Transcript_10920/g.23142 Transcript_10920/m.23142 type:complete len:222 (+) Transcript_10920:346-1011(+)